jgi:CheY-like chemotaxis protein
MARVLIAVSNGAVRLSLAEVARNMGHTVDSVADAGECLTAVCRKDQDLLFLDPALARIDAVRLLEQFRVLGHLPRMRIVLVDAGPVPPEAWEIVARQAYDGVLSDTRESDIRRSLESALGPGMVRTGVLGSVGPSPLSPAPLPPLPTTTMRGLRGPDVAARTGPVAAAPDPAAPAPVAPPPAPPPKPILSGYRPPGAGRGGAGRTLLLVEDTPAFRFLVGHRFEQAGWKVEWAGSAEEAETIITTRGCDVLLSDIGLPGVQGHVLAGTVRKRFPGVRVLLMTGMPPESRPEIPAGIPVLQKPLRLEELLSLLS